ncbi:glycosyltransferase family 4 protein [Halobacterium salinarum]|uniref:glycosyltransferase family 4 protein n=1 Tax=Halobacterium salinarum TaxID=2242 RepID=UPI002557958E|nr:glycosyltransferase family 4 protein [Halobacterium salinarum]MDL0138590.1 glycosyltransferase family 4 protein [Halobacterium salinarum]
MGGPQKRVLEVAERLRRRNLETVFLIPTGTNEFAERARSHNFEAHQIRFSRLRPPTNVSGNARFLRDFVPSVSRISSLIQERNIDVVHANMVTNFQTALATARTEVPLVWHFNDTLTPTPVKQLAAHAGVRWADELVVAADAVHDYYFSPSTPSRTIYAPVDIDQFEPTQTDSNGSKLRSELGLEQGVPIVGTVGNINPIKGHEYLLRAASEIIEDGQQIAVPIVGAKLDSRETYFEELRSLRSDLGLEEQVEFVGFRSDIPELLSLFDVFVLPSKAEACPIVVLEAMAMECPVVATDVGGVPEEIPDDDHGWVVPPTDSRALARAIREALDNPNEAQRRASNARARVESMFSLTECVGRHEALYRSLVEGQ